MHYKSFLSYSLRQIQAKAVQRRKAPNERLNMSGYILFSSEMRAVIKAQHPDYSLGSSADWWGRSGETLRQPRKRNMKVT